MNAPVIHNLPQVFALDEMERMSIAIAKSGLFGIKDATQALALMLVAQAEGQHPATIAQEYDVIQGKASRKTHSVLARFQAAGGTVKWEKLSDEGAIGTFSHPQGGSVTIDWTIERAKKTMVWDNKKDAYVPLADRPMYRNGYPRSMFRARCIAEGVRAVYPAALGGMVVPEEARDPIEKDVTPTDPHEAPNIEGPRSKAEPVIQGTATRVDDAERSTNPAAEPTDNQSVIDKPMDDGKMRIIRAKLKHAGLTDLDLISKFGPIDALTASQFGAIQEWIKTRTAG